jgi:hypothetical protein
MPKYNYKIIFNQWILEKYPEPFIFKQKLELKQIYISEDILIQNIYNKLKIKKIHINKNTKIKNADKKNKNIDIIFEDKFIEF